MQLKHEPTESGSYQQDHGSVQLLLDDSTVLAEHPSYQNNKSIRNREANATALVQEMLAKMPKKAEAVRADVNATAGAAASS